MRKIDGLIVAAALGFCCTSVANAQAGAGGPVPGSGNSTQITNSNRETNAQYNHVIGTADPKASQAEEKPRAAKRSAAAPATIADIKAGSPLRDTQGVPIGTIDSVDADGAVVNTGQAKIKVPLAAFGKDDGGLLLGITAARFNELVAKAHSAN
jgi:hypothetical protein